MSETAVETLTRQLDTIVRARYHHGAAGSPIARCHVHPDLAEQLLKSVPRPADPQPFGIPLNLGDLLRVDLVPDETLPLGEWRYFDGFGNEIDYPDVTP